jgi:fatty-acyl-CoA synthase
VIGDIDASTGIPNVGSATVGRLILSALARFRHRPALRDDRHAWSYEQLADAMARITAVFERLELQRGDGFAMLLGNCVQQVACQYAAILFGLRYTALHPLASIDTHRFVLRDAEIRCLLFDPALVPTNSTDFYAGAPMLRHVLALGSCSGALDLAAQMEQVIPRPLLDRAEPDDIAYLLYTGGTTGVPKGVMLPHRSIVAVTLTQAAEWDLPGGTLRFLAATPTSHASGAIVTLAFLRGGYVRLVAGFEPESFCRLVAAERINLTFLVPTMLYVLLDHPACGQHDLSSLQTIMYGAAPMSAARLQAAISRFGQVLVQLYGQTEAPMVISALRKADHDPSRPELLGSCGLPTAIVQVKLMDSALREVPVGDPGEICLRGAIVMDGYWKQPELTAEAFRGGWLHTGDIARQAADGYLTIVDRTKDMIISGGFNVYPREVEDALLAHEAVAAAAVIGVPDDKWGEAVTAYVVLRRGCSVEAAALRAHVRELRGPICAPKSVFFVDRVPLTALGKVDRKALRVAIAAPTLPSPPEH